MSELAEEVEDKLWQDAHADLCGCVQHPCCYPGSIAPYRGPEAVLQALSDLGYSVVRKS